VLLAAVAPHALAKKKAPAWFYLLPDMGRMTGRLLLHATTSCFSDHQRGEHAAILYAALGSAKLEDLDRQGRLTM